MRKIKCLGILGAIFGVILMMIPAGAHVGVNPHVGNARWNNRADLTYQFVGNVGIGWNDTSKDNMRDAIGNVESNVLWPPDAHVGPCDSNPGKCINMVHKTCDGSSSNCPRLEADRGSFYVIYFFTDGSVTQRVGCAGIAADWGLHTHTDGSGCLADDFAHWDGTLSTGEANALNNAYCDSCRGTDESDEGAPPTETVVFPTP